MTSAREAGAKACCGTCSQRPRSTRLNWQNTAWKARQELLDEIPSAYKDIDEVIANAKSLIEVKHTLRQFINVKGD